MPSEATITVKVLPDTLHGLHQITTQTGEKQYILLKRLVEAEVKRLNRQRSRPESSRL